MKLSSKLFKFFIYFLFITFSFHMKAKAYKYLSPKKYKRHKQEIKIDTFFNFNPNHFNTNFSSYDQETAIICGILSELSYLNKEKGNQIITNIQEKFSTLNIHYDFIQVEKSGTELMFFGTDNYMVIAFRGTQFSKVKNLITDAKIRIHKDTEEEYDKKLHLPGGPAGFRRSMISLLEDDFIFKKINDFILKNYKRNMSTIPIYLTGHSLGAALASLFVEPLTFKNYHFSGAYLFAPPLAISKKDAEAIQQKFGNLIHEIVNYRDYIPRAMRYHRKKLKHIGTFYRIHRNGELHQEPERFISLQKREKHKVLEFHRLINHIKHLIKEKNANKYVRGRKKAKKAHARP